MQKISLVGRLDDIFGLSEISLQEAIRANLRVTACTRIVRSYNDLAVHTCSFVSSFSSSAAAINSVGLSYPNPHLYPLFTLSSFFIFSLSFL